MQMKKRSRIVVGGLLSLLVLSGIVIYSVGRVVPFGPKSSPTILDAPAAKFEYYDPSISKAIFETSDVRSLGSLILSLDLVETDEVISDWLYKITFNCKEWVPNGTETIVLVGENALSIDGVSYTTREEVPFSSVVDTVAARYKYYGGFE